MNWPINRSFDLMRGHPRPHFINNIPVEVGDANCIEWNVTITRGGEPVSFAGASVYGYFVRADQSTVIVEGTFSGNVLTVVTPPACFAVPGDLKAVMRVTQGTTTITVDAFLLPARKDITDSIVDPGTIVPDLQELLDLIDDMEIDIVNCMVATQAAEDVVASSVRYDIVQSLSAIQKAQAQQNIGFVFTDDGEGNLTMG